MQRENPRFKVKPRPYGKDGFNVVDTHKVIAVAIGVSRDKADEICARANRA